MVDTLDSLARDDSWDVLLAAREIVAAVAVPLADVKQAQEDALRESQDFLTSAALKQVEDANKRELTARERSGMMEALAAVDSLLRDVLLRCEDVSSELVNEDAAANRRPHRRGVGHRRRAARPRGERAPPRTTSRTTYRPS